MTTNQPPTTTSSAATPSQALTASIESESVGLAAALGDTALDAALSSGAFDGVPVVSLIMGAYKAQREVRDHLYAKKVVGLLHGVGSASTQAQRDAFVAGMRRRGEAERFGETVLLLLEQIDDARKPHLMGRIIAAHMSGRIAAYEDAMRLVAMIQRAYAVDLGYLKTFRPGIQAGNGVVIAASLEAVGLLVNTGIDGGADFDAPGGYTYAVSVYGQMLLDHGQL